MFKWIQVVLNFKTLLSRPPVAISVEELQIFQQCFLSLYSNGYNEPIDPIFVYQYQLLYFFQNDSMSVIQYISENTNQNISVAQLGSAVGFEDVLARLGPHPAEFEQEVRVSDWVDLAQWEPLQIAKTEIALGRDQRARDYLQTGYKPEYLEQKCTNHDELFERAKADALVIRERVLSPSNPTSFESAESTAPSEAYLTPAVSEAGSDRTSLQAEENASRRECYRVIPTTKPPSPPRGGGFFGLNGWMLGGFLVGLTALGIGGALIFRFRKRNNGFFHKLRKIEEKGRIIIKK